MAVCKPTINHVLNQFVCWWTLISIYPNILWILSELLYCVPCINFTFPTATYAIVYRQLIIQHSIRWQATHNSQATHDDAIQWKHFPRYWTFVRVTDECPSQRPVTRSYAVFFDLPLKKYLSKQSNRRWLETPMRWLWRQCTVLIGRGF